MQDRRRPLGALSILLAAPMLVGGIPAEGDVVATVTNLRSSKGQVLACMTAQPTAFPGCDDDPSARTIIVPAHARVELDFGAVPRGRYAISIVHDENGNGKLDKRLMMPREGYGFSNDAPVRMGPPSFSNAAFDVTESQERLSIRMRYMF
ncbi:DUF2141 domain-containing protein [Novosphingobium aquimarinum]|uniref:DUF2141 domain-containing protein n=1 Tax=Novosphingobium aquimarinum TaxID=2682494 RepID=UPI002FC2C85C